MNQIAKLTCTNCDFEWSGPTVRRAVSLPDEDTFVFEDDLDNEKLGRKYGKSSAEMRFEGSSLSAWAFFCADCGEVSYCVNIKERDEPLSGPPDVPANHLDALYKECNGCGGVSLEMSIGRFEDVACPKCVDGTCQQV